MLLINIIKEMSPLEYTLIRSSRKTLALNIDRDGRLIVRAPYRLSVEKIEQFIAEKADWIEKHTAAVNLRTEQKNERLNVPPTELPLFGRLCPVVNEKPYGYTDGVFYLPEGMTLESLVPYLHKLYTRIAKEALIPRVQTLSEQTGLMITAVKINSAKTRWGSCSSRGNLNFNWRLLLMPEDVMDYVVVHELAHRREMNHSAAFWQIVETYLPDYRERRQWLKENGNRYSGPVELLKR